MWYREVLAVRRPLFIYVVVVAVIGSFNAWGAGDSGSIALSQAIAVAAVFACIFALVVGTHLGNERRHALHSVFVRPISRAGYAWTVFAIDITALGIAYVLGLAAFVLPYQIAHGFPVPDLRGVSPLSAVLLPIAASIAWYGLAAAAGVITRGARSVAVLLGPVALALWCGAAVYAWHVANVFRMLSLINPLMYTLVAFEHIERAAHPQGAGALNNGLYDALSVGADTTILFVIGTGALLTATFAWQRSEA